MRDYAYDLANSVCDFAGLKVFSPYSHYREPLICLARA